MERVTVGKISRVRGIKGEMVVVPLTDDPRRFLKIHKVIITKEENIREFLVERVREFKGKVLLKLKQVESPEEAIGLRVITTKGQRIGKIKEVISLPANDVYLVEGDKKQYDIPAIKKVVRKIDLEKREMIIEPIEGLFNL
jgi:16S rRNA processing protein RimM